MPTRPADFAGVTPTDATVQTVPYNSDGLPNSDTFVIGVDACPGRCELEAGEYAVGWDERKATGVTGATLVPTGDALNEYTFKVYVWAGAQWAAFQAFAAKYLSAAVKYLPGTTTPRALSIYHPVLAAPPFSVTEVVLSKVTAMVEDEDGAYSCKVTFKQYRKPQPALGKGEAAIAPAQNPTPTAKDAAESEFVDKFGELAALAGSPPGGG